MFVWGLAGFQHQIMTHRKTADTISVKLPCQGALSAPQILYGIRSVQSVVLPPSFDQSVLSPVFRLRRRLFHQAFSRGSLPAQPSADQRDPQRECGPRRALGCYHRAHAGPQTPGPVFNGAPGQAEREL